MTNMSCLFVYFDLNYQAQFKHAVFVYLCVKVLSMLVIHQTKANRIFMCSQIWLSISLCTWIWQLSTLFIIMCSSTTIKVSRNYHMVLNSVDNYLYIVYIVVVQVVHIYCIVLWDPIVFNCISFLMMLFNSLAFNIISCIDMVWYINCSL